jgi:hypothetical protein
MALRPSRVASVLGAELGYVVRTSRLATLGWERINFHVACHRFATGTGIDGLLGLDFLAGMRLVLDLATGSVELTAPPLPRPAGSPRT